MIITSFDKTINDLKYFKPLSAYWYQYNKPEIIKDKKKSDDSNFISLIETITDYANSLSSNSDVSDFIINYLNMEQFVANTIADVPEVEYVFGRNENNVYNIWTFIKDFDRIVRRNIYRYQRELTKRFPEFCFDFYVISLEGKSVKTLTSEVNLLFSRK